MQQKIFDLILNQDDVTWRTILYDLVKTEQMDPWDINITLLTKKYLDTVKRMIDEFGDAGNVWTTFGICI